MRLSRGKKGRKEEFVILAKTIPKLREKHKDSDNLLNQIPIKISHKKIPQLMLGYLSLKAVRLGG